MTTTFKPFEKTTASRSRQICAHCGQPLGYRAAGFVGDAMAHKTCSRAMIEAEGEAARAAEQAAKQAAEEARDKARAERAAARGPIADFMERCFQITDEDEKIVAWTARRAGAAIDTLASAKADFERRYAKDPVWALEYADTMTIAAIAARAAQELFADIEAGYSRDEIRAEYLAATLRLATDTSSSSDALYAVRQRAKTAAVAEILRGLR